MTLSADLGTAAAQAAVLETALATSQARIAELEADLLECLEGTPVPDPDPDPIPGPQPPDGHYVALSDDINKAVAAHPANSTFVLEPGARTLVGRLTTKTGNRYWSDPVVKATFKGPGAAGSPFAVGDVSGVVMQGIAANYFGPANTDQGAGMIDFAGGADWLFEDCDFGYSNRSIISGGGSWTMRRTHLHHGGKYAAQGAFGLIEDSEWSFCGRTDIPGVVGWTASQDKGGCKFVQSKGMRIVGLHTHHHGGTGLWWDIKNEDWYAKDVVSEDNARHGISMEVSFGPGELIDPIVRRCGTFKRDSETSVPVPAAILVSMTSDVTVINATVEDCWNGLIVRQWAHPQFTGTVGTMTPEEKKRLGCENIIFQGGSVTRSKQFDAGVHGNQQSGARPTRNVHWNDVIFDPDANTCSPLHIG